MTKKLSILVLGVLLVCSGLSFANSYDFGGQTVAIELGWMSYSGIFESDPRRMAALEEILEDFNVVIDWRHNWYPHQIEPLYAAVIAGEAPDLIPQQSGATATAAMQGLLTPLDNYLNPQERAAYNKVPLEAYSVKGRLYGFNGIRLGGYGIYWNHRIFEEMGLPNLYDLVEADEWTWDAMREIAIAATRDTTGDGVIDQWGFEFIGGPNAFIQLASNEARLFEFGEDGRPVFTADQPASMEAFELLYDLAHVDGSMPSEYAWPQCQEKFRNGQLAMVTGNLDQSNWYNDLADSFGFVPFPKGPRADEYHIVHTHTDNWAIPITSEHDPAALIALNDALWQYIQVLWFPGTTQEELEDTLAQNQGAPLRDAESFENFKWAAAHSTIFTDLYAPYSPWYGEVIGQIFNDAVTPSVAIGQVREMAQAHLDEVFGF